MKKSSQSEIARYALCHQEVVRLVNGLPKLLAQLKQKVYLPGKERSLLPKQGVYAFYYRGKPVYVGRSNRLRARVREHTSESSNRYTATFAFKMTKVDVGDTGLTRAQLEERYNPEFKSARRRVKEMSIHAVEVPNQCEQALFELYAVMTLNPKYNDCNTH